MACAPLLTLVLLAASGTGEVADWRYGVGIHDFMVPDVDSDTYGIDGHVSLDKRTASGRHVFGSADLFVEHDKDHLDPGYTPIWWQIHIATDGDLWRAEKAHLGWSADANTRINTVSSVERQITAMPALIAAYDGSILTASVKGAAGWFFLEIDDDVPKSRGYARGERGDFRNSTLGYTAAGDLSIKLGASWALSGGAQEWWDTNDNEWLETHYEAALRMGFGEPAEHNAFVLSVDAYRYNLDPYFRPEVGVPIMAWDDDVMIRLRFEKAWHR